MAVLLLVALGAVAWFAARPSAPDAFNSQPLPPDARAGALLKSDPFTRGVPPDASDWRMLYVTARAGKTVIASAIVVVAARGSATPRPVVAWAHGTIWLR